MSVLESPAQVFSKEFCENFKNKFFTEHFQATTSVVLKLIFKAFEKYP